MSDNTQLHQADKRAFAKQWAALTGFIHDADVRMHGLADKAKKTTDEAQVSAHLGIMELEQKWESAAARLLAELGRLRGFEKRAVTKVDTAKVHANLATKELRDAVHELREKLRSIERTAHAVKVKAESEASKTLKSLAVKCNALSARLDGLDS